MCAPGQPFLFFSFFFLSITLHSIHSPYGVCKTQEDSARGRRPNTWKGARVRRCALFSFVRKQRGSAASGRFDRLSCRLLSRPRKWKRVLNGVVRKMFSGEELRILETGSFWGNAQATSVYLVCFCLHPFSQFVESVGFFSSNSSIYLFLTIGLCK